MVAQLLHECREVAPKEAAGLGGAGAGHHRRIKPIEIHREIDRLAPQGLERLGHPLDRHQPARLPQLGKFLAAAATDGDLQQLLAGQHLQAAAHGAGVAVLRAQPLVAQVGVGIELHQHQLRVLGRHGRYGAGADRVFAAQHQRLETQGQHRFGGRLHRRHHRLGGAEGDINGAEVGEGQVFQVAIELGAVALQAAAHLADCRRPEAGAGAEGGGAVVGHAK